MAHKKPKGPSSFCEWVVGTTIESAMGQTAPQRSRRREVIRVEVSTDDESEEDSIRITYPRPSRARTRKKPSAVKKVRFEEVPRKSALKKNATSDSDPGTSESSSEAITSSEASGESSDEVTKSSKGRRKSTETGSDNDSEPHPTCKCEDCIRGRQRLKKQGKNAPKQKKPAAEESSGSDTDTKSKNSAQKAGKKTGEKAIEPETDGEISQSAPDSEEEPDPKNNVGENKKKQKQPKEEATPQKRKHQNKKAKEKAEEPGQEGERSKTKKNKSVENQTPGPDPLRRAKERGGQKKGNYPEAFPGPHPRRPHYIEPVRAEVVQTERVMETPQDPPPNAFYDAEHNIIRVYHGPVWGGNPNQSLYPHRDPSLRSLPVGMPHPTQNPYFHGFNNPQNQQQTGYENFPITQGMPVNAWNAMCPPQGFPPIHPGGAMQNYHPGFDQGPGMNGGAFNPKSGGNGGPPSSKDKDKAEANNVGPGSIKSGKDNPYIPRRAKSQFSGWGSNRTASHGSRQNASGGGDGAADGGGSWNGAPGSFTQDPNPPNAVDGSSWGNQPANGSAWDSSGDQSQNNSCSNNNWGDGSNNGNGGQQDGAAGTWGDSNNDNGQASWGDTNHNNNADANGQWDNENNYSADASAGMEDNNVGPTASMPGAFNPAPDVPFWGDPSLAVDTGGQLDTPSATEW